MRQADLVIVGAGCSGLSLAVHLVEAGVRGRRIVLVEPREGYRSDRTWSFWKTDRHPFEGCVNREWNRWLVRDGERQAEGASRFYPYQRIDAGDFYQDALERLSRADNVEVLTDHRVTQIKDLGSAVEVVTDRGSLRAAIAFDSRPPRIEERRDGELLQHFLGWEVVMDDPVFDPEVATLMDFSPSSAARIQFTYVLPSSARRALVEATVLSPEPLEAEAYRAAIRSYLLRRFGTEPAEVVREERGVLPMTRRPWARASSRRIIGIGMAGGAVRPSTGYAFLAIQRFCAEMARRVLRSELPIPPRAYRRKTEWLDRIFLTRLNRNLEQGPALFSGLFERAPVDPLIRFLSDRSSWIDDLRVVSTLPKLDFSAAALRTMGRRWTSA